jgi:short subunit dehydrogenase-like uncharacterized protein
MMTNQWMIYGSNGYTGSLIAHEARRRGMVPLLGGRSEKAVQSLGAELNLPTRCFSLSDPHEVAQALKGVSLVLHCAGPFSVTSAPMLSACMKSKTNYLDITGEIDVFEEIFSRKEEIQKSGIVAVPGVGFDVVPTDCLAALLKARLPDANQLILAFNAGGAASRGTATTAIEGLGRERLRRNGKIVLDPDPYQLRQIPFQKGKPVPAIRIPWGDVSTAFYSTGVPNIEVYMRAHSLASPILRAFHKWVSKPFFKKFMKAGLRKMKEGPGLDQRQKSQSKLWGEVRNANGQTEVLRASAPEGYTLTSQSSLAAVKLILESQVPAGAYTPSQAFGSDFLLNLPNVKLQE